MSEIEKLKKKRSVTRSLTTKLINTCDQYISGSDIEVVILSEYLDQLTVKYENLVTLNDQIQNLITDETEFESEFETSETYCEKLISMKSKLKFLSGNQTVNHNNMSADSITTSCSYSKLKLPKLKIACFDGNPLNWLSFWNQFDNAIHKNDDLTDIDKFNYLYSLVVGAASNAINGFSLSSENYAAAIELLKNRFGRKDLIINAHMGKLLNLDPVKNSNNTFALRKLYDNIEIQIRNLNSLNVTSGTYGTLLTPILLKLLPNDLNVEFQRKRKSREDFDVNELIDFLRSEIECRETATQIQNKINYEISFPTQKENRINKSSMPTFTALNVSMNECVFCRDSSSTEYDHVSEACPLSITDRKARLKGKGACFLCLKRGNHLAKNCFNVKMKCKCGGGRHNALICEKIVSQEESESRNFNLTNKTCAQKVYKTPESLKRKLMMTEDELHSSNAKLKEKESLISIIEPNNKKICVNLESKLEECKKQNQIDSEKIEELRSILKWVQEEATQAKSKIYEVERQKKIEIDKLEMRILSLQQEYSNLKTELADVKCEKAETARKLNIDIESLELKVTMLTEENEKSQEYIQSLKRQKNKLAEKAAMTSALEKELKEATDRKKVLENKIEADKDASLIIQTRQAELKKLAELQKENCILKEEVTKNRENNIALYQEKLWSYQEKKSLAYAELQEENDRLKKRVKVLEEEEGAAATDVTIKVQHKLAQEESDSTIKKIQDRESNSYRKILDKKLTTNNLKFMLFYVLLKKLFFYIK